MVTIEQKLREIYSKNNHGLLLATVKARQEKFIRIVSELDRLEIDTKNPKTLEITERVVLVLFPEMTARTMKEYASVAITVLGYLREDKKKIA